MTTTPGAIHTVPDGDGWKNEREQSATLGTFDTKAEAQAAGRDQACADEVEHIIHNSDGTIGERNSYGGDPSHRPG